MGPKSVAASTRGVVLVAAAAFVPGCAGKDDSITPEPQVSQAVAAVSKAGDITIVFSAIEHQARLPEVVAGQNPMDFHWTRLTLDPSLATELSSQAGVRVNMADAQAKVRFAQVYRDVCNPAMEDFSPCWLYESYSPADAGLQGTVAVRIEGTTAIGMWDITWEGTTDRFGNPPQWHRHGTTTSIGARIVSGGEQ